MSEYEKLSELFRKNGQEQVFAFWSELSDPEREELLADCRAVDFFWLAARWQDYGAKAAAQPAEIVRAPVVAMADVDAARRRAAIALGEEKLRQGKVAAFTVAGGQGSRLGYEGPKGCYPIGPVTGRSLFQWHAEQILARGRRCGRAIPWYVMTSAANAVATREFFEEKNFFGLRREDVFFFSQGMVPCLDFQGKLMLAGRSRLAMNPDGHGGSLAGLLRSGALADMRRRGVEMISYFQVDNPLVGIADPYFVGSHALFAAEMSSKVLEKVSPEERIGVVCLKDGRAAVVEYTDLDPRLMQARRPDGKLEFWAGSIAIHMLNVDFVERVAGSGTLPWHWNRKKVPFYGPDGLVKPKAENAVKFETFVFDALPQAEKTLNLEIAREEEFAPVKNAEGADSVVSCRAMLVARFRNWLAARGVAVPDGAALEISRLYALDEEDLGGKIRPGAFTVERELVLG